MLSPRATRNIFRSRSSQWYVNSLGRGCDGGLLRHLAPGVRGTRSAPLSSLSTLILLVEKLPFARPNSAGIVGGCSAMVVLQPMSFCDACPFLHATNPGTRACIPPLAIRMCVCDGLGKATRTACEYVLSWSHHVSSLIGQHCICGRGAACMNISVLLGNRLTVTDCFGCVRLVSPPRCEDATGAALLSLNREE